MRRERVVTGRGASSGTRPRRRGASVLAVLLGLGAPGASCGLEPREARSGGGGGEAAAAEPPGLPVPESPAADPGAGAQDPRLADVRRALEAGLPDAAWTLLDQLGDAGGVTTALFRARAALLGGDPTGALRELEDARRLAPDDPRVFATEVELLATLDRLQAAEEVLLAGWKAVGRTPELDRAHGVLLLRTPGAGPEALAALEKAVAADPDLPFAAFPLAQAHLLTGRAALGTEAALAHARAARDHDPSSLDYLELEAEALAGLNLLEEALERYAELEAAGRDLGSERALLHWRLATLRLLERDRPGAIESYLEARRLGLDDEGLGHGVNVLAEEARARIDEGIDRLGAGDHDGARARFERALELEPGNLEAANHRAVSLFLAERYREAARAWEELGERAGADADELPDPIHMNLARAWRLADEPERARVVLSDYLDEHPEGRWSEETRALLERLEAETLGDR